MSAEPTLEVNLTYGELQAAVKSLSIGCDQLAKKIERAEERGDKAATIRTTKEYKMTARAKRELESVLFEAMGA
jgi:hypothetical protein